MIRPGRLSLLQLTAATYLMVSGGPYGLEELFQTSGYRNGLLILILTPLVWSVPVGLMVAELAAAIPAEGGFYVWVRRALGPFWGFQEAWLSLAASIFDMAVYPVVFVLSLGQLWPAATRGHNAVVIEVVFISGCVIWNLFGARAVGQGSILMTLVLLSPFFVLTVVALLHHGSFAQNARHAPAPHRDILAGIVVAMWNFMGWDNASTVADEVENPQRTYPRVMGIALTVILVTYMVPVIAVAFTGTPASVWATGSWVSVASTVAGTWLGLAVLITTAVSTLGTFNSLTMSYSRLPFAMAEDGYLPRLFTRTLRNGVPWAAVIGCGVAWMLALGLTFDRLLMLDILLYGLSLILEFVALAVLRVREPALPRRFRVPGGLLGASLLGFGPAVLLICAGVKTHDEHIGNISALTLGTLIIAAGVVAYLPGRRKRVSN